MPSICLKPIVWEQVLWILSGKGTTHHCNLHVCPPKKLELTRCRNSDRPQEHAELLLLLTSFRYWCICVPAVELSGAASLLSFELQKSFASSKVSFGSFTNQNSAPSMKIDVSWCPPEMHSKLLWNHDTWWQQKQKVKDEKEISRFKLRTQKIIRLSTQTLKRFVYYQNCTSLDFLVPFLLKQQ